MILTEQKTTILIADDNEQFLFPAREILRRHGFRCECVSDGPAAERRLAGSGVDVAVVDLNLTGVSGIELLQRCRSTCPDTVFVMISGWFRDGEADRCLAMGADATLAKPFSIAELVKIIEFHRPDGRAVEGL